MKFDEEGLLEEPCLSCDKAYVENIWHEWCCDEKECTYKDEKEKKMRLVIDIPEKLYYKIKNFNVTVSDNIPMASVINDGIPLPKSHGRLIDADALVSKAYEEAQGMTNNNFGVEVEWLVDKNPTIIEADKEE